MQIEDIILQNLIHNEEYTRKVIPFLKDEYFQYNAEKTLFKIVHQYINKYNTSPTIEAVAIELSQLETLSQETFDECKTKIEQFVKPDKKQEIDWLLDKTEEHCKEKAIHNALLKAVEITVDKTGKLSKGAIPQILQDALAVSFDNSIGHDYLEDADLRYDEYHKKENKIKCHLDFFNKITKGGVSPKTLTIYLAATGVGKTLVMCDSAAFDLQQGRNVLYITLEMGEIGDPSIAERIDANLLDVTVDDLLSLPKDIFDKKIKKLKDNVKGKLIVKEYATGTAGSQTFRALLNELKIKKNFIPDIIYIDYLNLCISSKLKADSKSNSYLYIKTVAEELRALAIDYKVPVISATQANRDGYNNSDMDLTNTSESIGLPMTVDFMLALYQDEELHLRNHILVTQLKNRYTDPKNNTRFIIGVDKPKMRLYDVDNPQENISGANKEDTPVMDNGNYHERLIEEAKPKKKFDRKKALEGLK